MRVGHNVHVGGVCQEQDAGHHAGGNGAEQQQRGGRVLALGLAEVRHAVADGLNTRQGGGTRGEGAQQQERPGQAHQALVEGRLGHDLKVGRRRPAQGSRGGLEHARGRHGEDAEHENVGGDGKDCAGLADAAQVHQGQDDDADDGDDGLGAVPAGNGRGQVVGGRGHGHRHRQHIVHQQGRGHREPGTTCPG